MAPVLPSGHGGWLCREGFHPLNERFIGSVGDIYPFPTPLDPPARRGGGGKPTVKAFFLVPAGLVAAEASRVARR